MKKFRTLLLAGLVATPALVLAQNSYEESSAPEDGAPASHGRVRGVISRIDFGQGTMTISVAGGESFVVRGTPGQLASYRRGEVADVTYDRFVNSRWLSGSEGGGIGENLDFARVTTVSGSVSSVDKAEGSVVLELGSRGSASFKAHPDTIRDLVPGQFISLTYERVARNNWVTDVGQGGESGTSTFGGSSRD